MTEDPALFEATPVPRLRRGDYVTVQTMWGNETCLVLGVDTADDFPMAHLRTASGDEITVSVARCTRAD